MPESVGSGHDEQTEGRGCFVCGRPQRDHPGGIECAGSPEWQPDPRTVAAVVDFLYEHEHNGGGSFYGSEWAALLRERFQ